MANVKKNSETQKVQPKYKVQFAFGKINYILLIVGVVFLAIGYICLAGGGSDDPSQFSEALFDTRRLVVAPILIALGLVIDIVAIMYHPKNKEDNTQTNEK